MNRIKNIFISIIYIICIQTIFFFHRKIKLPYCIIIAYHSIPDSETERFKKQMQILKRLTTPISISYDGPFDSKTRYTIVTFDDAFKNVIRNALPEMTQLKIPFAIFIPAGCLSANPNWLENTGDADENETISSIDELSKLPAELVTYGSHTVNHPDLILVDYEKACFEIKESKTILESQLNRGIQYFAFPYGNYNAKITEYCHEVGYMQVFTVFPESPLSPLGQFVKGRVIVRPSDWRIEFVLKILGGYGWKACSKSIKKILLGGNYC